MEMAEIMKSKSQKTRSLGESLEFCTGRRVSCQETTTSTAISSFSAVGPREAALREESWLNNGKRKGVGWNELRNPLSDVHHLTTFAAIRALHLLFLDDGRGWQAVNVLSYIYKVHISHFFSYGNLFYFPGFNSLYHDIEGKSVHVALVYRISDYTISFDLAQPLQPTGANRCHEMT